MKSKDNLKTLILINWSNPQKDMIVGFIIRTCADLLTHIASDPSCLRHVEGTQQILNKISSIRCVHILTITKYSILCMTLGQKLIH